MIRAIIFDCFGVIITDALQQLRHELHAVNPEGARAVSDIVAANNLGLMEPGEANERIASILGISTGDFKRQVAAGELRNAPLLAHIRELRGTYKTAMLSNIAGSSLARRFPKGELAQYFDVVVASSDIGFAKPEPEAYQLTAERLGVRCDECVFVDDRQRFCEGATAVGMQSILYTDFVQLRNNLASLLKQS